MLSISSRWLPGGCAQAGNWQIGAPNLLLPNVHLHFYRLWLMPRTNTPKTVTGRHYVDDQCIDCDLCRETAPANFKRNDDGGHSYVYKQPETPEEEALCKEAMEGCPVEAIGNDGA
jgi:ferredoxin